MSDQAERICAGLLAELKEKVLNNLLDSSSTVTGDEVVERVLAEKLLPVLRAAQAYRKGDEIVSQSQSMTCLGCCAQLNTQIVKHAPGCKFATQFGGTVGLDGDTKREELVCRRHNVYYDPANERCVICELRAKVEDLLRALKMLPLDSFGDDMSKCDAADFVDHAGEFFEAMALARAALARCEEKCKP